jgi:ubiquinol-cytochrome c reductase cytochrome b subunit
MSDNGHLREEKPGIIGWIDYRLPIFSWLDHFKIYKTPKNLNYLWNLGSIAGLGLVIQIITGVILAMHYTPHVDLAFLSVEHIMRDVEGGWLQLIDEAKAEMFVRAVPGVDHPPFWLGERPGGNAWRQPW